MRVLLVRPRKDSFIEQLRCAQIVVQALEEIHQRG